MSKQFNIQFINLLQSQIHLINTNQPNHTIHYFNYIISQLLNNPQYKQTLQLLQTHLNTTNPIHITKYLQHNDFHNHYSLFE